MLYRQLIGTAMGMKPAPDYANIFMSVIDKDDLKIAKENENNFKVKFYRRYLDDIYMLFNGTSKSLHDFLQMINQINPNIKFTITHSTPYNTQNENDCDKCECEALISIPFLDTQTTIKNNMIIVDLYKKPTDRNMYLLTSSCHPNHITTNIPYSLALRITRICSETETRDLRHSELRELLLEREYKPKVIDSAIEKARQIPRKEALKRVVKNKTSSRPVSEIGLLKLNFLLHKTDQKELEQACTNVTSLALFVLLCQTRKSSRQNTVIIKLSFQNTMIALQKTLCTSLSAKNVVTST